MTESSSLAPLQLKKNEERRIRAGHLWVYSNEVDTVATPLSGFEPGQQVQLLAHNGKRLGNGYVNPNSLICARLVSRDPRYLLDRSLLVHRLNIALALRERLFDGPYYRLVYGEADQLPGLVIDRYGDVCVVQCTTAGMEAVRDQIVDALHKVLHPAGIVLRADSPVRQLEGLDLYQDQVGEVPEQAVVEEHGLQFSVSLAQGQKTGWFYDQRMNRARLRDYVSGKRVLDVFSYVGAWGLQAAAGGAGEVLLTSIDRDGTQEGFDIELLRIVTDRVENALAGVPNVEEIRSVSEEGTSRVTLEFAQGTNIDEAANDVRAALDRIRDLSRPSVDRNRWLGGILDTGDGFRCLFDGGALRHGEGSVQADALH